MIKFYMCLLTLVSCIGLADASTCSWYDDANINPGRKLDESSNSGESERERLEKERRDARDPANWPTAIDVITQQRRIIKNVANEELTRALGTVPKSTKIFIISSPSEPDLANMLYQDLQLAGVSVQNISSNDVASISLPSTPTITRIRVCIFGDAQWEESAQTYQSFFWKIGEMPAHSVKVNLTRISDGRWEKLGANESVDLSGKTEIARVSYLDFLQKMTGNDLSSILRGKETLSKKYDKLKTAKGYKKCMEESKLYTGM